MPWTIEERDMAEGRQFGAALQKDTGEQSGQNTEQKNQPINVECDCNVCVLSWPQQLMQKQEVNQGMPYTFILCPGFLNQLTKGKLYWEGITDFILQELEF